MAYRKIPQLSDTERATMISDLRTAQWRVEREQRIYHATLRDALKRGFTSRELAAELGTAATNITRWAKRAA